MAAVAGRGTSTAAGAGAGRGTVGTDPVAGGRLGTAGTDDCLDAGGGAVLFFEVVSFLGFLGFGLRSPNNPSRMEPPPLEPPLLESSSLITSSISFKSLL